MLSFHSYNNGSYEVSAKIKHFQHKNNKNNYWVYQRKKFSFWEDNNKKLWHNKNDKNILPWYIWRWGRGCSSNRCHKIQKIQPLGKKVFKVTWLIKVGKKKKVTKLTDYWGFVWNFRTCPEYEKFYIFSNKEIRNGMMENCFVTYTIGFVCMYRHTRLNKRIGLDLILCFWQKRILQ